MPDLQYKLMSAFHDSVLGAHSGVPITYQRMKQYFAWKGMKAASHPYLCPVLYCLSTNKARQIQVSWVIAAVAYT
jgi:hypothetical protein